MITEKQIQAAANQIWYRIEPDSLDREQCVEIARAALEAAEAVCWQPIVTAPKDGTRILLCDPQYEGLIDIGIWDYGEWCTDLGSMDPTHWMLIPPPPTTTEET